MKSIGQCSRELWEKIETKLNHGVVFIDNACAELLHWNGGMNRFLYAGAQDVREFSSFESGNKSQMKGVFILSTPLYDVGGDIIKDIITSSNFQYVIVVSTVGSHVHLYNKSGSTEADEQAIMEKYEEKLLQWMGNMNYTAEIMILPLFTAEISSGCFVTPAFSSLFPLLSTDVKRVELLHNSHCLNKAEKKTFDEPSDIENNHLPKSYLTLLKMFASGLNGLLESLDVKEDIYYIGHTSRWLANELDLYPPARNRRKVAKGKTSIVFIDRTLDLCTPVTHQYDCLLDKIINILPKLPGHNNDTLINMSSLCSVKNEVDETVIEAGCLARSSQSLSQSSPINSLVTPKVKEGLMDVNRQLVESASNVKLPVKLSGKPGRVTPNVLYDTLNLFRANYSAIQPNLDILQVAMATAQTISHKKHGNLDNIVSVEKKILQMVGDKDSPSILSELTKILKTESQKPKSERILNLDDILSLLMFSYSLSGADFSEDEENQFQADLIEVIMEENEDLPPVLKAIIGDTINRSIVMAIVEDIWCKLVAIGTARQDLQQFSSVYERGGIMAPTECKPLLNQIIEEILNPAKTEIVDIKYKQSGMKDLLKSGFGLFMNVSKPRPSDHPLLLLYIVGGVTPTEVKHIQDIVHKSKTQIQVVISSTRLLRNTDAILSSLSADNVTFQS